VVGERSCPDPGPGARHRAGDVDVAGRPGRERAAARQGVGVVGDGALGEVMLAEPVPLGGTDR